MFNTFQFNTNPFNLLSYPIAEADQDAIVFNGYGLQNANIISSLLRQDSTPSRDLDKVDKPRDDGRIIIGDYWRAKNINVAGVLKKDTNLELEQEIDAMKKALAVREANLDITIAGTVRRYRATLINGNNMFDDRQFYHLTFIPFKVQFETVEPFGYALDYDSTSWLDQTDLTFEEEIVNNGTIHAKPVIIIDISLESGITAIAFTNETTNETITITRAYNALDYLVIDSENKTVTVNGAAVDFTGIFPRLDTGENAFSLTLTGTSATYTVTVKHKTPYL